MAKHTERSSTDSFGTKRELKVDGVSFQIFDLTKISSLTNGKLERLPYSIRVLLESLLRNEDGRHVRKDDVQSIIDYNPAKPDSVEIPFKPARVILQDFTGVPAVVDLAAMRSAMTRLGGDPAKINPLIPVDLVIDHSVQVDAYKSKDALAKNTEIEFDRNKERYEFLRWGQQAFSNFRVVPPSSGIVHQVNLEYLASVVQKKEIGDEIILLPDSLVGTDSHTTMINGLGVVGWGVGGIEAEAVMLGQPVYMLSPEVVGVELTGQLKEGATATDLTLTITQKLREHGVVGKFVEFYGPGLDHLTLPDRATIANMAPEYGATMGFFPIDEASLSYMRATGRSAEQVAITESYCRAQGLFRTNESPSPSYASVVKVELGQIVPSLAGPRRPQDRIPLSDMKSTWSSLMGKAYDDGGFGIDGDRRGDVSSVADRKTSLSHGSLVIAAITSCTNTSNPSVMIGAGLVAKKALEYGLRVPDYVKCSLAPGSRVVTAYLERAGLQSSFEDLGFFTVGYGCTTCIGNSGPLDEAVVTAIQEKDLVVTSVLSGNRNFEGRVSPHTKGNFLASPPLVVAYALAGKVDIDFETEAIGTSASGDAVYFRDLWPTAAEVNALIETSFDATLFRKSYDGVESSNSDWNDIKVSSGDIYAWSSRRFLRR